MPSSSGDCLLASERVVGVDSDAAVHILVLLDNIVLDADGRVLLIFSLGTALFDTLDDVVGVAIVVEWNRETLGARLVDDTVNIGNILVVRPLFEKVAWHFGQQILLLVVSSKTTNSPKLTT